jgi:5-methylcytosine-specific restriction endonuclease McrA
MYSSPQWRALRDAHLAECPICTRCGRLAEIAHHVTEHQGDPELFYNAGNLESLCRVCHEQHHRRAAHARRA